MTTHTPGPWHYWHAHRDGHQWAGRIAASTGGVQTFSATVTAHSENECNEAIALAAAAPEMLAALNGLIAEAIASRNVLKIIADGRTTDARELAVTRLEDSRHSPNGDAVAIARTAISKAEGR